MGQNCPPGNSNEGGLCYPNCRPGYTSGPGDILFCSKTEVPPGYADTGLTYYRGPTTTPKETYTRTAGTSMTCRPGEEELGGLCYPTCRAGYASGSGDVLFCSTTSPPPPGYADTGLTFYRGPITTAKDTYTRGAGVPRTCRDDEEEAGGLCYPKPKPGFSCVATVCTRACPTSLTEAGLTCTKKSYGRTAGVPRQCPADQIEDAGLCYPKPRDGYGCTATYCSKPCPTGMRDDGLFCAKDTITRGAGTIPNECPPGQIRDGLLCYPQCKDGYHGVGPVCWENFVSSELMKGRRRPLNASSHRYR